MTDRCRKYKITAWIMTFMMAMTMIIAVPDKAFALESEKLSDPRGLDAPDLSAGYITEWDCVWFDTYPQTEITADDGEIYTKLVNSDTKQWEAGCIWIDGVRYMRLNGNDTEYPQDTVVSGGYDFGGDYNSFHYFRFEPIKWRVLDVDGNQAVLLADKIMESSSFHPDHSDKATWSNCNLRSWLNGYDGSYNIDKTDFSSGGIKGIGFTKAEQKAIKLTSLSTRDSIVRGGVNDYGDGEGGPDTQDYLYLLQESDVFNTEKYTGGNASSYGFSGNIEYWIDDENRAAKPTEFAHFTGTVVNTGDNKWKGFGDWWLRGAAEDDIDAAYINSWGNAGMSANQNHTKGVRPVITLDLNSNLYSYAGITKWDGSGREVAYDRDAVGRLELKNPVITESSQTSSGQNVIWSGLEFGSYPQTEILPGDPVYDKLSSRSSSLWMAYGNTYTYQGVKYYKMQPLYTNFDAGYYADFLVPGNHGWSVNDKGYAIGARYFKYEPIKWRVLETNGSKAMLMADLGIDAQVYNDGGNSDTPVYWSNSTMRSWLNGYDGSKNLIGTDYSSKNFIDKAFTEEQQTAILETPLTTSNNLNFGSMSDGGKGGPATTDKIFLLQESDVYSTQVAMKYGFHISELKYDESRQCRVSDYAWAMGASREDHNCFKGSSFWWLRSPGRYQYYGMYVLPSGGIDINGEFAAFPSVRAVQSVRPVINVDISLIEGFIKTDAIESKDLHTHDKKVVAAVKATCTDAGQAKHLKCSGCGTLFDAANPEKVVTAEELIIPAAGHKWETFYTPDAPANFSKDGSKSKHCSVCDAKKPGSQASIYKLTSASLPQKVYYYNADVSRNPKVTIKNRLGKTIASRYYKQTSTARKNVGRYDVKVTFDGKYFTGSKTLTYDIRPTAPKMGSISRGNDSFTLKWDKQKVQTTGYQIGYTTKKDFTDLSYKKITNLNITKATVKNLKSGKKYYVSIRSYKTVKYNGKNVTLYSPWRSPVKTVTTK